ncbi:MAG TPA: hypothetical protein VN113_09095, partial [Caulobacter sp.]|nr:hypothetical protein [Caulobacter sp.]
MRALQSVSATAILAPGLNLQKYYLRFIDLIRGHEAVVTGVRRSPRLNPRSTDRLWRPREERDHVMSKLVNRIAAVAALALAATPIVSLTAAQIG